MQRQRQEEREGFQQAQRQYSSLPRYGARPESAASRSFGKPLPATPPRLLPLTHGSPSASRRRPGGGGIAQPAWPSYRGARRLAREALREMPVLLPRSSPAESKMIGCRGTGLRGHTWDPVFVLLLPRGAVDQMVSSSEKWKANSYFAWLLG